MNLQRTLFILPNLFTLANVFSGFFALTLCTAGQGVEDLYQAALAICFGFFFDLLDGRVARLTKTQSKLGIELDSLADVVTFGAAPSLLVYKWGLSQFGWVGIFVAFLFLAGGAFRLARFNVLADREPKSTDGKYFIGLPIPAAASIIVSLVVVHHRAGGDYVYGQGGIAILVVILAYLMTSRVRFRSFKKMHMSFRTLGALFLITAICILIVARLRTSFIFIFLAATYLAAGLTEEVYRFASERRRMHRQHVSDEELAEGEDSLDDDDEVLRELGAEQ